MEERKWLDDMKATLQSEASANSRFDGEQVGFFVHQEFWN